MLRGVLDDVARAVESRPARDALLFDGVERLPAHAYDRLPRIEDAAVRPGYADLS